MPDAWSPARNSNGTECPPWKVSLEYDPRSDRLHLHFRRERTLFQRSQDVKASWGPDEVEDAITSVTTLVRTAGALRLF